MTLKQTERIIWVAVIGYALFSASIGIKWGDWVLAVLTFLCGVVPVTLAAISLATYAGKGFDNPYLGRGYKPRCHICEANGLPYLIECSSLVKERWGEKPLHEESDYHSRGAILRTATCSRGHRVPVQARAVGARFSLGSSSFRNRPSLGASSTYQIPQHE